MSYRICTIMHGVFKTGGVIMKKSKIFAAVTALAVTACMVFTGCSVQTGAEDKMLSQLDYDEEAVPSAVRNVVILSGTWEEMGYQYASQLPDTVKRCVASGVSGMLSEHTYTECMNALQKQLDYYDEHAPEVSELFQGLADGAGIDFETVALGMGSFYGGGFCSTMAAWGEATEDGRLIAGANWDTESGDSYFLPTIIAYPEDGHAFIASCGFFGNIVMNDAGVVFTGSSGQSAEEDDTGLGLPVISPMTFLAAKCKTAEKAKDLYISDYAPGTGDNFHVADKKGSYIVEHTASKNEVRRAGDFGETDYTIATNDFMTENMQSSLYSGEDFWDDNRPRYWTEERVLLDDFGNASLDTFAEALGCNSFYIPENWKESGWAPMFPESELKTGWNDDVWNLDKYQGYYTPENREPTLKTVAKGIADPENMTMYIMNGSSDTLVSGAPDGTGNYMCVKLCETYEEAVYEAQHYAYMQNWLAARDISQSSGDVDERTENLDTAKKAAIAGENYAYRAGVATDGDTKRELYGKAISKFCEAQCYAQLAQNDPTKIAREGGDY